MLGNRPEPGVQISEVGIQFPELGQPVSGRADRQLLGAAVLAGHLLPQGRAACVARVSVNFWVASDMYWLMTHTGSAYDI